MPVLLRTTFASLSSSIYIVPIYTCKYTDLDMCVFELKCWSLSSIIFGYLSVSKCVCLCFSLLMNVILSNIFS